MCRLVLAGFDGVRCVFTRCDWVLDGPAENTLLYLSAFYHGLGTQGPKMVESIFDSIRRGTVGQHIPLPALAGPYTTR